MLAKSAALDRVDGKADEGVGLLNQAVAADPKLTAELSAHSPRTTTNPDNHEVRCQRAAFSLRLGHTSQAASWYRAALACDPRYEPARAGLSALGAH